MKPKAKAIAVNGLNLFDVGSTLYLVGAGLSQEANPAMAALIKLSPVLFILGKTLLVAAATAVCLKKSTLRMSRVCLNFGLWAFSINAVYLVILLLGEVTR